MGSWDKPKADKIEYIRDLQELVYHQRYVGVFKGKQGLLHDHKQMRLLEDDLKYYEKKYEKELAEDARNVYIDKLDPNVRASILDQLKAKAKSVANGFFQKTNVDEQRIREIEQKYTLPSSYGFFPEENYNHRRSKNVFVVFDTETDDRGRILRINATKYRYDYQDQKLVRANVNIPDWSRTYVPKDLDVRTTESVHHLNRGILQALRKKEGGNYSLEWNKQEREAFLKWVAGDVLVGHNIEDADIPWLYSKGMNSQWRGYKGSFFDTVHIARGFWKGQKNDLESLSERLGVPFSSIPGLTHHDSFADTIVTAKIFEKMLQRYAPIRFGADLDKFQTMHYDDRRVLQGASGFFKKIGGGKIMEKDIDDYTAEDWAELMDASQEFDSGVGTDINGNNTGFGYSNEDLKELIRQRVDGAANTYVQGRYVDRASDEYRYVQEAAKHFKNGGTYEDVKQLMAGAFHITGSVDDYLTRAARLAQGKPKAAQVVKNNLQKEWDIYRQIGIGKHDASAWQDRRRQFFESRSRQNAEYLDKRRPYLSMGDINALGAKIDHTNVDKFAESVDKLTRNMKGAEKVTESWTDHLDKIGKTGWYDWTKIGDTYISGQKEINSAMLGIVPGFMRPAFKRALTAGVEVQEGQKALWDNRYSNVAKTLSAATPILTAINPMLGAVGGVAQLGTNIIGGTIRAHVEKEAKETAAKINYLGAAVAALSAPLSLFRSGLSLSVGIFKRLGSIWGDMPGMPLTHLTGIGAQGYSAMLAADNLMGFRAGTTNEMHNALAYGQAGLYTSGQFDTNRLVAAARLGIFSDVYAPMGGDTVSQQARYTDKLAADLRNARASGNKRREQEVMYFASQIDANLPMVLQKMNTLGITSYAKLQNGSLWAERGVYARDMNDPELSKWTYTAGEFGRSMQGFSYGLKRVATPLWDSYGKPIMNTINKSLDFLSDPANQNKEGLQKVWGDIKEQLQTLFGEIDFKGFSLSISTAISDGLRSGLAWLGEHEQEIVQAFAPVAAVFHAMLSDLHFDKSALWNGGPLLKSGTSDAVAVFNKYLDNKPGHEKQWKPVGTDSGVEFELTGAEEEALGKVFREVSSLDTTDAIVMQMLAKKLGLKYRLKGGYSNDDYVADKFANETIGSTLQAGVTAGEYGLGFFDFLKDMFSGKKKWEGSTKTEVIVTMNNINGNNASVSSPDANTKVTSQSNNLLQFTATKDINTAVQVGGR